MRVNQDPFSNGTERAIWLDENCERCVKASRYKGEDAGGEEYTKCRCSIQRDIFVRMCGDEPISQRTIDVTQKRYCPYKLEHWPKRDKHKKVPTLF